MFTGAGWRLSKAFDLNPNAAVHKWRKLATRAGISRADIELTAATFAQADPA